MPARSEFFKRADFGRNRRGSVAFGADHYNAEQAGKDLKLVVPHELSSKFLLRMRGEDRPAALASLDQQAFLRQVLRAIRSNTIAARKH
jgi:hypothetical protein